MYERMRNMNIRRKYRYLLFIVLFVNIICIFTWAYYLLNEKIPDQLKVKVGTSENFDFELPLTAKTHVEDVSVVSIDQKPLAKSDITLDLSTPFSVELSETGTYSVDLQFLGITLKKINVEAVQSKKVMPVGVPVGIHIRTSGVMVLGTGKVTDAGGNSREPARGIVKSGDYIQSVNGTAVDTISEMTDEIQKCGGKTATLQVLRDGQPLELDIQPVLCPGGEYKTGIWVRDDTQGIGTLSFVDKNNRFAALGHGITDVDTSLMIQIEGGALYPASVGSIIKGADGSPGEMVGTIYYSQDYRIGTIEKNTDVGIYGTISAGEWFYDPSRAVELGYKQDVHAGPALIRCCVDGTVKDYEIKITNIDYNSSGDNKDFIIEITDPILLEKTNGIIQGMSGSPILQDGKLVGAVTHVFVNDPTRGYGIFIENMLEAAE